ncbi:MAG: cupin domain-containing protein [Cyanobacteria bacterium J06648_10]
MQPGSGGPSPHIHKQMTEIFYVVEGEVELTLNEEKVTAQPGAVMVVPQSVPHAFANPGQVQSKLLIMFCPAKSREQYFEGLAELTKGSRKVTEQEMLALMHRFDQYPVSEL